jgi:3-keto-5-aminohexanoate cleavage enzyme
VSTDPVILSCALTGAVTTKKHCPAIPYTPVEIAEEARRAYEAGAAIVHIHARNDDGSPTWAPPTFQRIMDEIRTRCPVLINWSTGGMGPMQDRVGHLAQKPAIAALNMGSMNYAKWNSDKQQFAFNFVFANSPSSACSSRRFTSRSSWVCSAASPPRRATSRSRPSRCQSARAGR